MPWHFCNLSNFFASGQKPTEVYRGFYASVKRQPKPIRHPNSSKFQKCQWQQIFCSRGGIGPRQYALQVSSINWTEAIYLI